MSTILALVRTLLFGWIVSLIHLLTALRDFCRGWCKRTDPKTPRRCFPIDHPAFLRPDPLLYSQRALMAQGLAVTWDNPDITLFLNGIPVPSSQLQASTTYEVRVRVWNNSLEAPVVHMPVHLSFLAFGVGTQAFPVATTRVDVGVKGSPSQPAIASVLWTTPATSGHYCLQALLDPADDLDFLNNLGQENTDVAAASSPAAFSFTLRNDTRRPRRYRFEPDAYVIPEPPACGSSEYDPRRSLTFHRRDMHPVPPGFDIAFAPASPTLAPGGEVVVQVSVTPPAPWTGRQPINVNCFHDGGFAGGVTLTVTKGV